MKDVAGTDVTSRTPVALTISLACLALLPSKRSVEELDKNREVIVLTVENFHGLVRGKDAKFPILRMNLGLAVAETEKTYMFNKESLELSLTQQDEVKSVIPAHLVLLDKATDQILIDQIFHLPELHVCSIFSAILSHNLPLEAGIVEKSCGQPIVFVP